MPRSRKNQLPPLRLPATDSQNQAVKHHAGFNPIQPIPDMEFDDLHDDVRDLVIGSPIPQFIKSDSDLEKGNSSLSYRNKDTGVSVTDYPAIRVVHSSDQPCSRAPNNPQSHTAPRPDMAAAACAESRDTFDDVMDNNSLSPSPKLFRRKNNNHVKYFKINDDACACADDEDEEADESDVTTWFDLKHDVGGTTSGTTGLEVSPNTQRRVTRLSPILSPSSMLPTRLSPRTSPSTSPRLQRKKERISAECSPISGRKTLPAM